MTTTTAVEYSPFSPEQIIVPDEQVSGLARAIGFARQFTLLIAVYNSIPERNRAMEAVEKQLPNKGIERIPVTNEISNLRNFLRERTKTAKPDAVFVFGMENWIYDSVNPLSIPFIRNLNAARDAFPADAPYPLVLWVSETVLKAIAEGAPDFLSVRSGLYLFTTEKGLALPGTIDEASLIQFLEGLDAASISRLVTRIPGAAQFDKPGTSPIERIAALMRYVESSVGPGLEAVARAGVAEFPDRVEEILPALLSPPVAGLVGSAKSLPHRSAFFTGRTADIERLRKAFVGNGKPVAIQAISGLGGIGKTALALEYAYQYANEYDYLLLAPASSVASLENGYRAIAQQLGLPQADATDPTVTVEAVRVWLSTATKYLLILDNADFSSEFTPRDLARYLPRSATGHILITTRAGILPGILGIKKNHILHLGSMSPEEAVRFLIERVYGEDAKLARDEEKAIAELAEALGYLPLALEQAAAYISERQTSFRIYLALYRKQELSLLEKAEPEAGDYLKSVGTTWDLSFQELERESPAAADLLTLSAFLAPEDIPSEVVFAAAKGTFPSIAEFFGSPEDEDLRIALFDDLLTPLLRYSLATKDTEKRTFSVHRLVQAVVREHLDANQRQAWTLKEVEVLNASFPYVEFTNWPMCERLTPHVQYLTQHLVGIAKPSLSLARLLNQAATYLEQRGRYSEAEPLFLQALEIRQNALPKGHPDIATSLNNLANLYESQGRYSEAEPLHKQALEIRQNALPKGHPDIATSLNNLAYLYESQGRYSEAEPLYKQALEIQQNALPKGHPDIATSLNNLATLYESQGRYSEAEPLHKQALEIRQNALPEGHPDIAASLNNLAYLHYSQGRYSEAEPLYKQALEIDRIALGENHPDFATDLNNLALLYYSQGRYSEAEPLCKQALEIRLDKLGEKHPFTQSTSENLKRLQEKKRESKVASQPFDLPHPSFKDT